MIALQTFQNLRGDCSVLKITSCFLFGFSAESSLLFLDFRESSVSSPSFGEALGVAFLGDDFLDFVGFFDFFFSVIVPDLPRLLLLGLKLLG